MIQRLPDTLPKLHELDADASCPQRWGWMQGSPPPADKVVRFANGYSRRFPQLRWTFPAAAARWLNGGKRCARIWTTFASRRWAALAQHLLNHDALGRR